MFLVLESSVVSSPCPLLPDEAASDFLPQVCMRVPNGTAWIPIEVDVASYTDGNGDILERELESALEASVDYGDRQHDEMSWPEPMAEYDSWLNRRLAIALRGWGDIVERRGVEPQSLAALREIEALAQWVCDVLHQRSRQLADNNNWCPALDEAGAIVLQNRHSSRWDRRWKKAVKEVAVRHRNLTTISPWDVFPRGKKADLRYADLLPLTRFADSLAFHCDTTISHWNVNDFNSFYDRVAAIARANGGGGLVAKQV